ncbi:hypothetical protein M758_12G157300 [Ceratodon purpureus]|uniref:Uncharacterized protein n=1 Tax=Ceratodon purpureus TaxID=3225 RepID=A0A8T0G872_CERPU|nr:hypothetical protein KC19_12G154900 [Ceratodon purpureus]KAG0599506.1 hypothetical protein M758_12G157300 [Ceratodon purpureus]
MVMALTSMTAIVTLPSSSFTPSLSGLFLPSLSSTLLVQRKGHAVAQLPGYGMPSYGSPRPYQTPGADFHNGARPAETISNPSFGDKSRPGFEWNYKCPADYSTPLNYQTPKGYEAPKSYGPGSVGGTELGTPGAGLDDVKKAELDAGGNGGSGDGNDGGSGGRGDGDGDGDGGDGEEAKKKLAGLSMSQKLTLAYAILVGVGGIMGFAKTGSSKSLMAGGGSALILYYVFLNLPTKPIMSSIIGLGISGLLLFVMGSRYSESGKVFPAGVVSLYSLVMAGGYIHGVMRGH